MTTNNESLTRLHEVYKRVEEKKPTQVKRKVIKKRKREVREEDTELDTDEEIEEIKKREKKDENRKSREKAEHKKAYRMQIRWDKKRILDEPKKIEKDTYTMDHICYTKWNKEEKRKEFAVAWTNKKKISLEPAKNLRKKTIEEYEKEGEYSEEDYMIYLRVRDKLRRKRRERRGEDIVQDENSSEINTSDIERSESENEGEKERSEKNT